MSIRMVNKLIESFVGLEAVEEGRGLGVEAEATLDHGLGVVGGVVDLGWKGRCLLLRR